MRGIAILIVAALAFALPPCALADDIEVREVRVEPLDEGLALSADFAFDINPRLAEAVKGGVPLYFVVEFELTRPRWWWFDEKTQSRRHQVKLSYHPVSRQYRLATGVIQQSFASLDEALAVLHRLRNWVVIEKAVALQEAVYEVAVRMRLDLNLLPRPFQVSAVTSRDWRLESPWKRFTYRHAPTVAPVELREPRREEGDK
jgi:hypothetical protein